MERPSVCFVGYYNLPILAPEFGHVPGAGGEEVQHSLLATALAARNFEVSMVVHDLGQTDGTVWSGVRTCKAFRPCAGIPALRFIHPRWTGLWSALRRADASVYYVSTAGVHVGQVVLFARLYGRKVIFRVAHDANCSRATLMIKYRRDRALYEYGLRHVDTILAQTEHQQALLRDNYGVASILARMPVDMPTATVERAARDVDVLWVNNLRRFKRADLYIELAGLLPDAHLHMIGGAVQGFEDHYADISARVAGVANLRYHGAVPYHEVNAYYERAKVFVNTSDSEGFPNSYLQAWARGTPVVAFFDPDGLIAKHGLGVAVGSLAEMREAVQALLQDATRWAEVSARCRAYMARDYDIDTILAPYIDTVRSLARATG